MPPESPREHASGRAHLGVFLTVLASACLVLGPVLLSRGYVLVGDMTFVPRQPWKPMWLGLDGSLPRAVPADAFVSVISYAVPGDLLQKALLLGVLVLGGWGVVRLLEGLTPTARAGGALLYVWNPYVYERLAIGHWGLLLGLAALPWVVGAAHRVRERVPGSLPSLWLWLAVAAFSSPTGGVVAALVALVMSVARSARAWNLKVAVTVVVLNLPWIVPGALGHAAASDPGGVQAFAARADTPLGVLGSLAGLGGIWKTSIVPDERASWVFAGAAVVVSAVALVALWRSRPGSVQPVLGVGRNRLLTCAVAGLALAWLPTTSAGAWVLEELIERSPGAGLLRDSQKWLMPFVLVVAIGFGVLLDRLAVRLRGHDEVLGWLLLPLAALPVLLLPGLAWGQTGGLRAVEYPHEWQQVAARLEAAGAEDDRVAVLPWSAYVRYRWNDNRAALDPAIRFFPGEIVTNNDLVLADGRVVRGEDSRGRAIGAAVEAGKPLAPVLRAQGVRWALVEKGVPSSHPVVAPDGVVVHDGHELTLVDVGGAARADRSSDVVLIQLADGVVVAGTLSAIVLLARRKRMRVG